MAHVTGNTRKKGHYVMLARETEWPCGMPGFVVSFSFAHDELQSAEGE